MMNRIATRALFELLCDAYGDEMPQRGVRIQHMPQYSSRCGEGETLRIDQTLVIERRANRLGQPSLGQLITICGSFSIGRIGHNDSRGHASSTTATAILRPFFRRQAIDHLET